jgi:hypothetical protein
MKKVYMQPQTEVFNAAPEQILAGSDPNARIDKDHEGVAPGDFESKQRGEWDIWEK